MDQLNIFTDQNMTFEKYDDMMKEISIQEKEREQKNIELFRNVGLPTVIAAVLLTFCLFRNYSGVTMLFAVAALVGYVYYCAKKSEHRWSKGNWFGVGVMGLLAVSDFVTADKEIILYNNIGIFLMFGVLVMHTFLSDITWTLKRCVCTLGKMLLSVFGGGISFLAHFGMAKSTLEHKKSKNLKYIITGACIAIPMLLITGSLLSSADDMFGKMFHSVFAHFDTIFGENFNVGTVISIGVTYCIFANVLYGTMQFASDKANIKELKEKRLYEAAVAITMLVPMAFMYVVFSIFQFVFLFGGALPKSYNYASYARTGFFQLLAVCIINLVMVLVVQTMFKEHKAEKILLTIVSVCTYVMLASSAYRMILYVQVYNLTRLRVKVLWALVLIAVLLVGVLIKIYKPDFKLFRYVIVGVSMLYLFLSFSHMDYIIAKYNKYASEQYGVVLDYAYLNDLSADAAGVIITFDDQNHFTYYYDRRAEDTKVTIRTFNVSKYLAGNNLKRYRATRN